MRIWNLIESIVSLKGLPRAFQMTIYCLAGATLGMVLFVARISIASSYLSDSPQSCINCHVMTDAYASWQRGSHGQTAVCTDCHVPHSNLIGKLAYKASDGSKHSYIFTFRKEPQVIEISQIAGPVIQNNCVRCHNPALAMVQLADSSQRKCWDCHENIHGSVHGLSASPVELRPVLPKAGLTTVTKGVK